MEKNTLKPENLIKKFLDGDRNILVELFSQIKTPLFSYLYRMSGSRNISEDILQETFLTIYTKASTFDTTKRFMPWAYTIARNKYLEFIRHENKIVRLERSFSGNMQLSPKISETDRSDLNNDVSVILDKLSTPVREAFLLKHYQQLKFTEIAMIQEMPLATVKSRVLFAMNKIREEFGVNNEK